MASEFVLDYRFKIESPADMPRARMLSDLMENTPNPLSFGCIPGNGNAQCSGRFQLHAAGNFGLARYQFDSPVGSKTLFTGERARSHLARNQSFGFNVVIHLGGNTFINVGRKRKFSGKAGDFFVADTETIYSACTVDRSDGCSLALPASWERIGDIRLQDIAGINYSGCDRGRQNLVDYALHLLAHPDALAAPDTPQKLYDVLALALNQRATGEHNVGLLALVCNYLDSHYAEPELQPSNVAAIFGISVRHLHRLFATSNFTFGEYLIEQRLAQARRKLADPACQHQKILNIAFDCGFRNINHFGNRFRVRYGVTPGEFRLRSAQPHH